jgi:hypothetical protein
MQRYKFKNITDRHERYVKYTLLFKGVFDFKNNMRSAFYDVLKPYMIFCVETLKMRNTILKVLLQIRRLMDQAKEFVELKKCR